MMLRPCFHRRNFERKRCVLARLALKLFALSSLYVFRVTGFPSSLGRILNFLMSVTLYHRLAGVMIQA